MYNSRPRVQRFTSEIDVPENYRGNAFSSLSSEEPAPEPEPIEEVGEKITDEVAVAVCAGEKEEQNTKKKGFGFNIGRFFGGGFGYEELLILGLILLVAQSEENEDTLLLLVLLLLVG